MTNSNTKLSPPPELVGQWYDCATAAGPDYLQEIADRAAQWGADQELEALLVWLRVKGFDNLASDLLSARRPKPQTLNSIALEMLGTIEKMDVVIPEITDTIRRALEALPE